MIAHVLLYQLRDRLRVVEARIATAATEQPDRAGHYLFAGGQLMELRSERVFLLSLIAQLEKEAQPGS